jgi:fermentation-respiration switch protein FrsA (DUF1100 family)
MKQFVILLLAIITIKCNAQVYSVGHLSINFIDNTRSGGTSISSGVNIAGTGRVVGTEVYYPAIGTGYNTQVADGMFPIVVLGHGFLMDYSAYNTIYYYLASKGYIVMLPVTESGASPNQGYFGRDLNFLATAGLNLNNWSSPASLVKFNGKILNKVAIGGHSMGGGCSFFAAASNSTVSCLFNFAAAEITPSSVTLAKTVTAPSLIFSGEKDCVVDTTVQNTHYDSLASSNKFHVILKNLTHCDFSNGTNTNCNLGQTLSGCGNQINNSVAFASYMNYLEPFLNSELYSNCDEGQRFMDSINTTSSLRAGLKVTGTIACSVIGIKEYENANNFSVFPNPATDQITVAFNQKTKAPIQFDLYDISGRLVLTSTENSNELKKEINLEKIDKGSYILYVRQNEFKSAYKIIKQ